MYLFLHNFCRQKLCKFLFLHFFSNFTITFDYDTLKTPTAPHLKDFFHNKQIKSIIYLSCCQMSKNLTKTLFRVSNSAYVPPLVFEPEKTSIEGETRVEFSRLS